MANSRYVMLVAFLLGFMLIPTRWLYSWEERTVVHDERLEQWQHGSLGNNWTPCQSTGDGMSVSQHTQDRLAKWGKMRMGCCLPALCCPDSVSPFIISFMNPALCILRCQGIGAGT